MPCSFSVMTFMAAKAPTALWPFVPRSTVRSPSEMLAAIRAMVPGPVPSCRRIWNAITSPRMTAIRDAGRRGDASRQLQKRSELPCGSGHNLRGLAVDLHPLVE